MRHSSWIFLLCIFFFCNSAFPQANASESKNLRLEKIVVNGNKKTSRKVIINELNFRKKKTVTQRNLKDGIANIRNTNLFSDVSYTLKKGTSGQILTVTVKERWTTIPIFKIASGGDVQELTLGVYDPNLFGEFIESGAQYQRIGDANSGVFWFKNPRLFGRRQGIDLQAWKTARVRTKYLQELEDPVIKTGFLHQRAKFYGSYSREFNIHTKGYLLYEFNKDTFTDDFLSEEVRNVLASQALPISTTVHFAGAGLDLGRLNFRDYLVDGKLLQTSFQYGFSQTDTLDDFWRIDFGFNYFKTLFKDITFAQRVLAGFTTTDALQYWYYLGGLDRIRGFADNRFAGRYFWLSNSEFRLPVYKSNWFVLQTVGFLDVISTAEGFKGLGTLQGASAGAGLRIFLPKLYRFVLRFDYATPLKKNDEMNFSFGIQQFF